MPLTSPGKGFFLNTFFFIFRIVFLMSTIFSSMKAAKLILSLIVSLFLFSCGSGDNTEKLTTKITGTYIPIDKGFDEYISAYTSGVVPVNSEVEIHFDPDFSAKVKKQNPPDLFEFSPSVKGKTEWLNETTLVFRPSESLDPGKSYTGAFNLYKLSEVPERLRVFPLRIHTLKKDFRVIIGAPECPGSSEETYILNGKITTSDYIKSSEAEEYLTAKLGKKELEVTWDHSVPLDHKFTIQGIVRSEEAQELKITWDGSRYGVKEKGSHPVRIPPAGEFSILDVIVDKSTTKKFDIVFSDPLDVTAELSGLIWITPESDFVTSQNSNIITLTPANDLQGVIILNVEKSLKNRRGVSLASSFSGRYDFTSVAPKIELSGKGVILPTSDNLIFPFKAANLKAVDLKIIKVFDNNLLYYLQQNDLNTDNQIKRFGRPVYYGKVDLVKGSSTGAGSWNLYAIDLADYIDVEPGVLYKVKLGMRRSYSTYPCESPFEPGPYEEMLQEAEALSGEFWDDDENYYEDSGDQVYYSQHFNWRERSDPCKEAYYSPDKNVSRNILASNLGIIAKKGENNILHVMVNDLISALPVNEAGVEVYDYQMQLIASGTTGQKGSVDIKCERKPFILIAKKDQDRSYLKTSDGASLSLSSFDVSGTKPEKGLKAFIYGERDVWRPGDSIFLSIFVKDITNELPAGHPVLFELINPLEQKVDNQVQKLEGNRLLVFRTITTSEALTGTYRAQFRIGGAVFTKRIRIETIKPNRLKINLGFPDKILGAGTSRGTLNAKWLNGSIARNLSTSVDYILKHTKTEFEKYSQYVFDDPATEFNSETVNIFDGKIDNSGNAVVNFDPVKGLKAPGMLNAVFTTRVSEQGGNESIAQSSYKFAPYPVFVGINFPGLKGKSRTLLTDQENEIDIVTLDRSGKPVDSKVELTVYKISYRWWWESDDENLAHYISNNSYKPEIRKQITTSGGKGSFTLNVEKNKWGRYLVRATTPGGHSTGKILLIDWPWEYGMKSNVESANLLSITTDKEKYKPGDIIELSFPAPENSRAIITLENPAGVLDEIRVNIVETNAVVKITATPEMSPNVYAYINVIQPHSQTVNDMPVRLYGVVPVMVEDPGTRLSPQISIAKELRSQMPFEIKVSEENKNPMTYTLAVVDEGLLDITGFKTPDPWDYFYAREALGVQTWDLYDFVLGAFGGTLERAFATGGDEAVIDRSAGKVQRFIPVVKFLGPFSLQAGKTNDHTITLPQYTGSVKVMIIAGNDRAFGAAEKSVPVRDPLMVLVTAPRVISPGEKASLPVTVFVQKDNISSVDIKAEVNDLLSLTENTKTISVSGEGEIDTEFTFTAGEKTGAGYIKVVASGGGETAVFDFAIEVRSPNPVETRSELRILRPGEKWENPFAPFGIEGSNSAQVELSLLPSVNLEKRLDYLIRYPYGCSEQILSAAFPQLWLKELSENDLKMTQQASANISKAVTMLTSRQMSDGGIALWPGSLQPDNWVTSYAGQFMSEAEKQGYSIPAGFRQKWAAFQKKKAREWKYDRRFKSSSTDQAYRLFTLALAGEPEKGAMNRLRETDSIPQLARWILAAAFITTGRTEVAGDLIDLRRTDPEPSPAYSAYNNYGSPLRDRAIILYTLTLLKNEEAALPLLKMICDELSNDTWFSTQSVAWGLFAYMRWAEMIPAGNREAAKINLTVNGEASVQTINQKQVIVRDIKMKPGNNQLTVENISREPVYATFSAKGVPAVSSPERAEKGLKMAVNYFTTDLNPLDHRNLEQGADFIMVVNITNNTYARVENIALNQMVPSGWEILNTRLFEADFKIKDSPYDYRDIRDDRVNTFFSLNRGETKNFIMILNAAYKGEFFQPSVWCGAMYLDNCFSRYPGAIVKVTGKN